MWRSGIPSVTSSSVLSPGFHLPAEPMRLRLLDRLQDGEATVQELADDLGTSQQNVSKHLLLLTDAAILARRRDGTRVHYRISDEEVLDLCERMCGALEHQLRGLAALVDDFPPADPLNTTQE